MARVQNVVTAQGNDISDLINRWAETYEADPVGLLAGLISESNLDEQAERLGAWPDWSEGLGQQTLLYASVGDHTATESNLDLCRTYYWQPENAIREAAMQYGAFYRRYQNYQEAWSRYNGGSGMAYRDNPNAANIQRGWDEAQAYVAPDAQEPTVTYDPDAPPERQRQPWVCSIRTATWMGNALGLGWDAGDMQDRMVAAGLVTPQDGLEDGTGEALEHFLHLRTGLPVMGQRAITWEQLQSIAGTTPMGMGSGTLYHWIGVRRVVTDGLIELMNPAPGYKGLGDQMTREQFNLWAPWNAIWFVLPATEEVDDLSAEERDELNSLRDEVGPLRETKQYTDGFLPILKGALGVMEANAEKAKGTRADLADTVIGQCNAIRQAGGLRDDEG